jgi:hypothetical protein
LIAGDPCPRGTPNVMLVDVRGNDITLTKNIVCVNGPEFVTIAGSERDIPFPPLAAGTYTVKFFVRNRDGVINPLPIPFSFQVVTAAEAARAAQVPVNSLFALAGVSLLVAIASTAVLRTRRKQISLR